MKKPFFLFFFGLLSAPMLLAQEQPPPPPPPPPIFTYKEEILTVKQYTPLFPGCEDITDKAEKKRCSEEKMWLFIYGNLNYPPAAKEKGIEGTVMVKFWVEKDGSIKEVEVTKDIGGGCGEEAMRVINKMPKWELGPARIRHIKQEYEIPIKFELSPKD